MEDNVIAALDVEILYAQYDGTALGFRNEPRDQGGEDVARMHAARRTRGEADADVAHGR